MSVLKYNLTKNKLTSTGLNLLQTLPMEMDVILLFVMRLKSRLKALDGKISMKRAVTGLEILCNLETVKPGINHLLLVMLK